MGRDHGQGQTSCAPDWRARRNASQWRRLGIHREWYKHTHPGRPRRGALLFPRPAPPYSRGRKLCAAQHRDRGAARRSAADPQRRASDVPPTTGSDHEARQPQINACSGSTKSYQRVRLTVPASACVWQEARLYLLLSDRQKKTKAEPAVNAATQPRITQSLIHG
jgi:hypothetical protein